MTNGIRLTQRDYNILHDCHQYLQLTLPQMHRIHFPNRKRGTVRVKVSRLVNADYLSSHEFSYRPKRFEERADRIYRLTKKGFLALREHHVGPNFKFVERKLDQGTLPHDLLLTEVLRHLQIRFPDLTFVASHLIPIPRAELIPKPDAIAIQRASDISFSVELELTAKSNRRYKELIGFYRKSKHFRKVLYITANSQVTEAVRKRITPRKEIRGLRIPHTGQFYFVDLEQLLTQPLVCKPSNGRDSLCDVVSQKGTQCLAE